MKKTFAAILALVAFSCQKENLREQKTISSSSSSNVFYYTALAKDTNFIALVRISGPIILKGNSYLIGLPQPTFPEVSDGHLMYKELKTVYSKMGFKDSASCATWFKEAYRRGKAVYNRFPNATLYDYQVAYTLLRSSTPTSSVIDPSCSDEATGAFIGNVAKCAALAAVPIVGEVAAGTCMIGALVSFNGALGKCPKVKAA